jgi:L-amino acid N-acyltransferase YncA
MLIRSATPSDFVAITAIYRDHVLTGTATFEIDPPDAGEMARRHADITSKGLPYLVAEIDGALAGYAYANTFRPRVAYRFTVENSVYLSPAFHRRGVGKALMQAVIAHCQAAGIRQMMAVIGDSNNTASVALHKSLGFDGYSVQRAVGLKFGRWLDTVTMQLEIGEGSSSLPQTSLPPA